MKKSTTRLLGLMIAIAAFCFVPEAVHFLQHPDDWKHSRSFVMKTPSGTYHYVPEYDYLQAKDAGETEVRYTFDPEKAAGTFFFLELLLVGMWFGVRSVLWAHKRYELNPKYKQYLPLTKRQP